MTYLPPYLIAMTSVPTMTESLTLTPLTDDQRDSLAEVIVERYLDGMGVEELEQYFRDTQCDDLCDYSDEELLTELSDLVDEEEYNAAIDFNE